MGTVSIVLLSYFVGGLLILTLFDIITKRIRCKLQASAVETQLKMISANVYLGRKTGMITFLIMMWLFWPAVLVGAITDKITDRKGGTHGTEKQGAYSENLDRAGGADSSESATINREPDR